MQIGKVFCLLWLAMLAGIMVPLLADELVLLATGAHVPAGMLGGFMVIGLVAAALAAGYAAARSISFRLPDLARGALLYLLSIAAVLALPGMTPRSRMGLIIVAVLPPLCMLFACWTTRRQYLNQTSGI